MKLHLSDITKVLSTQDYMSYEKVLDEMLFQVKGGNTVSILGTEIILSSEKDVDTFNRRMIQVHGIYGLV